MMGRQGHRGNQEWGHLPTGNHLAKAIGGPDNENLVVATRRGGIRPLLILPYVRTWRYDEGEEMSRLALPIILGVAACLLAELNRPSSSARAEHLRRYGCAGRRCRPAALYAARSGGLSAQRRHQVFPPALLRLQLDRPALADLPAKFTQSDPVELAEFSRRIHLDAVLLLAVPHHGYCTYETRVGVKFPGLRGDWYGRCVQELHRRNIAVLGYITLGHNWKFMRDHLGQPFVHSGMSRDGVLDGQLCLNAPGYLELVEAYTRELLTMYPVDALRYDMLFSPKRCSCEGCRRYYKELYGEELSTWDGKGWRRMMDFYLATLARAVNRLTRMARATKPSVEIWQNHINTYSEADVNLGRQHDLAYIEFGDPLRLLALKGILDKDAIIVGQTLTSPIRRTIMALGARCYQYVPVNGRTALPDKRDWFLHDLAPFFQMVAAVQPYLAGARTLSPIALVYCENTRFRYTDYRRDAYMKTCEQIAGAYLRRSLPLDFLNCLDLAGEKRDGPRPTSGRCPPERPDGCFAQRGTVPLFSPRWKLLVLPGTSGLTADELDALRRYVRGGGNLLVAGDALRHDARGIPQRQFDLADCLGLQLEQAIEQKQGLSAPEDRWPGGVVPRHPFHDCVLARSFAGKSLLHLNWQGKQYPLLHLNAVGRGRVAYLASLDCPRLTEQVIDWLAGPLPVQVTPADKHVILTLQNRSAAGSCICSTRASTSWKSAAISPRPRN